MKKKMLLVYLSLLWVITFTACIQSEEWTDNYDIEFPVPQVTSISTLDVEPGDTVTLTGHFTQLISVKIGNGSPKIDSLSEDETVMRLIVAETCTPGALVLQNIYKMRYTHPDELMVTGGGKLPAEVEILDFSDGKFTPSWSASSWVEAKELQSVGYDLNPLLPPSGYAHYYSMNDSTLYPPDQPTGQGGNIPYGRLTYDNKGLGFDFNFYNDPYLSILINTGNHIAYMSLVANDQTCDLEPTDSPGGTFANGEDRHYMQTDNQWLWYTFSLKSVMGDKFTTTFNSAGLFIRNSWDYGADIYPGFQLNIVKMVITEGPRLNEEE